MSSFFRPPEFIISLGKSLMPCPKAGKEINNAGLEKGWEQNECESQCSQRVLTVFVWSRENCQTARELLLDQFQSELGRDVLEGQFLPIKEDADLLGV
jgi:hypothetical protein